MKKTYNVASSCCSSPILWNVTTEDDKTGLCTKCKKWATVVNIPMVNV